MSRIVAIDPGYDRCGVAIVENIHSPTVVFSSCINTDKKDPYEKRLVDIYLGLESLLKKWQPTAMALETIFFSVNKKTAIKVAESRGVVLLLAGIHHLPLIELSPQHVKLAMTGVGNASKEQVQKMVSLSLKINIKDKIDDELDAIALGITALQTYKVNNLSKDLL